MAHYQVTSTSLTPSRPAPAAPIRRGNDIQNVLSSSGYASSFSVGTSSPSGSSYASSYSGIGGSPNRNSDMVTSSHIVRSGMVAIKEDGIVSWLWRPKWLVLKEQTLSIHKNEVSICPVLHSFIGRVRSSVTGVVSWRIAYKVIDQLHLSPVSLSLFTMGCRGAVAARENRVCIRCMGRGAGLVFAAPPSKHYPLFDGVVLL